MVMPKPTKLNIFNMYSVAHVNYGSMTLLVDRDRHVNGAPAAVQGGPGCAGATSPGEKRKHIHRRNSDLPLTSERACVRIQNIPPHSFIRSFTHSFSKRVFPSPEDTQRDRVTLLKEIRMGTLAVLYRSHKLDPCRCAR